ncbi:MAG: hypothetical protein ACRD0G_01795 [Acidimicrobiales bacterium]
MFGFHVRELAEARQLAVVRRILAPGGRLYQFFQPLDGRTRALAQSLQSALTGQGYRTERVVCNDLQSGPAVCVVARVMRE